jgi:hypothetical protein
MLCASNTTALVFGRLGKGAVAEGGTMESEKKSKPN